MHLAPCPCGRSLLVDGDYSVSLTPPETAIVQRGMAKPIIDREDIIAAFWGHPDLMPETWYYSMRVRLAVLRRKTQSFGFAIVRVPSVRAWRVKWRMAEPTMMNGERHRHEMGGVMDFHAKSQE